MYMGSASILPVKHGIANHTNTRGQYDTYSGADPGGGPGVQGPPLVPREGVLDPSSKMKKTAFIIFSFI